MKNCLLIDMSMDNIVTSVISTFLNEHYIKVDDRYETIFCCDSVLFAYRLNSFGLTPGEKIEFVMTCPICNKQHSRTIYGKEKRRKH